MTLIKSVLNFIPIFVLSVCIMLVEVRNRLHNLMIKFLWGVSDNARKIHLVDWNNASIPMDKGGLGIVRFEDLNVRFIVKWIYTYVNEPDNLSRRIVSAKSGMDSSNLLPSFISSSRKSLLFNFISSLLDKKTKASDLVHDKFRTVIENGLDVDFGFMIGIV